MAKQRPSVQKRQRDHQKRQREIRKAEKAALKRERRLQGDQPDVVVLPEDADVTRGADSENTKNAEDTGNTDPVQ